MYLEKYPKMKIKFCLIPIIAICVNASAQNLIHLNCEGNLISKYESADSKNTHKLQTKGSVTIDSSNGSVIEGTIAEGIIKIPSFTSTATDTRFRGHINTNNITEKQMKELNAVHLLWYYSFDRYSGNYNIKHWYKMPPMKRGNILWDEWDFEESGTCIELAQKKF